MPIKISAQTICGIAEEKLAFKPKFREDVLLLAHSYAKFGKLPSAVSDFDGFKRDFQVLLTAAGSAGDRLLDEEALAVLEASPLPAFERFALLHYVSVQRAFFSALQSLVPSLASIDASTGTGDLARAQPVPRQLRKDMRQVTDALQGMELPFTMAVNPASLLGEFFKELLEQIGVLLDCCNVGPTAGTNLGKTIEQAMSEYVAWASGKTPAAKSVRSFLNYEQQTAQRNEVIDHVNGLTIALENWIKSNDASTRRAAAWQDYKKTLTELPDDKATMFDESFGVRKVFVQPTAFYRVAGVKRQGSGALVSDVAGLLGTLISDRTSGEDLVLLCGGPGSGKSTLCRILASELASNNDVHPVFLRLRRLQDSQDIAGFIETHLQQVGVVDKLADLAAVPNLVLILDGFDELVMASRVKLREFFAALKDGLSSGPLRHAKAIVSGRDTLFPGGAGLPMGAHVISLAPFDRSRIEAWSRKWRLLHSGGRATTFFPENIVKGEKREARKPLPLEHLVSWPLTLHLVARAHTSGSIDLNPENASQFEKAVLYRSIVADTALRQTDQAGGQGRLNPAQMRSFVQAIAWEMYSSGREALDVSEGLPILRKILPGASEGDLNELAEVTVMHQPELTRGDETGFEFVHKSFSEYFAAEQIATAVEKASFQSAQWGTEEKAWALSPHDATSLLAGHLAIRLLTEEVQEMLEPMLTDFKDFIEAANGLTNEDAIAGLERKRARFEQLCIVFSAGGLLDVVTSIVKANRPTANPLESFANYASGLLFMAVALAKRREKIEAKSKCRVEMSASVLNRLIHIVMAGEVQIDSNYSSRALSQIHVTKESDQEMHFPPLAPSLLVGVDGLRSIVERAFADHCAEYEAMRVENLLLLAIAHATSGKIGRLPIGRVSRERSRTGAIDFLEGTIGARTHGLARSRLYVDEEFSELVYRLAPMLTTPVRDELLEILERNRRDTRRGISREIYARIERLLHEELGTERKLRRSRNG